MRVPVIAARAWSDPAALRADMENLVGAVATPTTVADLDLPEQARDGVLLIEWGDAVAHGVPTDHLLVRIEIVGDNERLFRFAPSGNWMQKSLVELGP